MRRLVHATAEAVKRKNVEAVELASSTLLIAARCWLTALNRRWLMFSWQSGLRDRLPIVLGRWLDSAELNPGVHLFVRPLPAMAKVAAMDEAMVATMAAATVVAMVVAKPCEVWPVAAPGGARCWPGWAGASDMLYRCALRVLDSLPYGWGLRQSCVTCSGRRADLWWKLLICNRSVNISMGSARSTPRRVRVHHTTTDHGPHGPHAVGVCRA